MPGAIRVGGQPADSTIVASGYEQLVFWMRPVAQPAPSASTASRARAMVRSPGQCDERGSAGYAVGCCCDGSARRSRNWASRPSIPRWLTMAPNSLRVVTARPSTRRPLWKRGHGRERAHAKQRRHQPSIRRLLLPPHRQRPLQPFQHHLLIRPPAEDRLERCPAPAAPAAGRGWHTCSSHDRELPRLRLTALPPRCCRRSVDQGSAAEQHAGLDRAHPGYAGIAFRLPRGGRFASSRRGSD